MKTELKTIKDLPHSKIEFTKYHEEIMIPERELKAEAIKRAKFFDEKMLKADKGEIEEMGFIYWKGRFDEVMEMNNLTEEDLKEDNN